MKFITRVDLQGRYRVTSHAYTDLKPSRCVDEQETDWNWNKIVASGGYDIPITHPHVLVEDADQRKRLA